MSVLRCGLRRSRFCRGSETLCFAAATHEALHRSSMKLRHTRAHQTRARASMRLHHMHAQTHSSTVTLEDAVKLHYTHARKQHIMREPSGDTQ